LNVSGVPAHPLTLDEVDFFDPAIQENWYPAYDLLREQAPVWLMPGTNTYVLTRYEDLAYVLRRTDLFLRGASDSTPSSGASSRVKQIYESKGWPRRSMLGSNPPAHKKYRDIADPFFTPFGAEKRRGLITSIVDDLIDAMVGDGRAEFSRQFATPLPVRVITIMMGFRVEDIPRLKVYSEAWVLPFRGGLTEDEEVYAGETGVEFQHFIKATMEDKRANPDDSVISYFVNEARFDGERPLTDVEIINMVDHLYIGGNETTTFALTSGLWLALSNPSVHAELLANPAKVKNFVEESLRCESPTMGMVRNAAEDTEVAGVRIPKGANLHLRYAAANRDPAMFACPADFDLDRSNAPRHQAFSLGETHCTGAGLSRLEQNVAFAALFARLPKLGFSPGLNDFTHHANVTLRALKELWIDWDPPAS
jgi:cytochrome P450